MLPKSGVSRDPFHLCAELHTKWPEIMARFKFMTGNSLILTCTWRSVEEQGRLYAQGRTTKGQIVTWVDGVKKKSNHNYFPARAMDVAVLKGGKVSWDKADYAPLGEIAKALGLTWGGGWKVQDLPHLEVKA